VVSVSTVTRWIDALLKMPKTEEALASLARHTGDATRDIAPATLNLVRTRLQKTPELLVLLDGGEESRDLRAMGRMFGEELPGGLVFADA
jgi:DNA-K related protein